MRADVHHPSPVHAIRTSPVPTHLVVFAKAPVPGQVKTRLIPALGAARAAALAQQLLEHTLAQALTALACGAVQSLELCLSPAPGDAAWAASGLSALPASVVQTAQGDGDLGARMARAVGRVTRLGAHQVLLVGTDCPALTAERIGEAAHALGHHGAVMLPAADGGYVLLGVKAPCLPLFTDMPWSTAQVAALTLKRLAALDLTVWQGPTLPDIDEPADLIHAPGWPSDPPKANFQSNRVPAFLFPAGNAPD